MIDLHYFGFGIYIANVLLFWKVSENSKTSALQINDLFKF